jgi:linoleate 10R-lipoxygenase
MPLFRKLSSKLKRRHGTDSKESRGNGVLPPVDEAKHQTVVNGHHPSQPEPSASPDPTGQAKPDLAHADSSNRAATPPVSPAPNREGDVRPASRKDVESTFQQFAQLIHASRRPLPTQSGDGQYLEHEEQSGILADLRAFGPSELKTVKHILEDKASGKPQDDRKMHMEEVIQLVAALPHRSAQRVELTSAFLDELWNSLQHPPMSYLGDNFRYRSADGSNNSYLFPKLGAANTPYARSVNPVTVQPGALPDPGLLFDSLLAREQFKPHPNKVSSIFFNWASLIIHGRPQWSVSEVEC